MEKIYLLASFTPVINFGSIQYFKTLDLAKIKLQEKIKEIEFKPGVSVVKNTDKEFQFIFSWEEYNISWVILEKELIT